MALVLSFTPTNACAGGNHFQLTIDAGPFTRTFRADRNQIADQLREEELEIFFRVLLHLILRQLANQSGANLRTKLASKTIDLSMAD